VWNWALVATWIQAFGQVAAAFVALYAVRLVHQYTARKDKEEQEYTRKRDRAEFLRNVWHGQQLINISILESGLWEDFEKVVYGDTHKANRPDATKLLHIFLALNKIQDYFFAVKYGIIDNDEYKAFAKASLRLVKHHEEVLKHTLHNRGYSEDFAKSITELLTEVEVSSTTSRD